MTFSSQDINDMMDTLRRYFPEATEGQLRIITIRELYRRQNEFDALVATLIAGTNVTLIPSESARTITISSSGGGGGGTVESVVAGTNINVDDSDPANPVVSAIGSGGDGKGGKLYIFNNLGRNI